MRLTLLGTGDAVGTPKVGCSCPQCTRAHEEGLSRLRTSILLESEGNHLLVDTSPDLRTQLLSAGSPHIDAVLWTHGHYDHYTGYGDFYRVQTPPPVYGAQEVLAYCTRYFSYLGYEQQPLEPFSSREICGMQVTLLPVHHPPVPTYGLRIDCDGASIGITSDTRIDIPARTKEFLSGVDLLVADAIVPAHIHINKHMNYAQACALAVSLRPGTFRFVHASHLMPWDLPHLGMDMETFDF
jgi:phosphoribosyl 1,2-cyclic phosphate phosphodiesterase